MKCISMYNDLLKVTPSASDLQTGTHKFRMDSVGPLAITEVLDDTHSIINCNQMDPGALKFGKWPIFSLPYFRHQTVQGKNNIIFLLKTLAE